MIFRVLSFALALTGATALPANCIAGDCRDGRGKARFDNGDVYEGTWEAGLMHGRGVYVFHTDARYEGEFRRGAMHGQGTMHYPDGGVYVGHWVGNKKSGLGRQVTPSGKTQDGRWVNGRFAGAARPTPDSRQKPPRRSATPAPATPAREATDNAATVAAITARPDRATARPQNTSGALRDCSAVYCEDGTGRYTYRDGAVYTGEFEDGQPSGRGQVRYANGDRYEGYWFGNAPDGKGTYTFANGRSVLGKWEEGRLVRRLYRNSAGGALAQEPSRQEPSREEPSREELARERRERQRVSHPRLGGQRRGADGETKMYAVVVGIGAYTAMKTLNYTDDDAYQMYAFLKSPEGGALADDQVEVLIDERATAAGIERALAGKLAQADADDIVVFYYSGHGVDGYFIPVDFDGANNLLSHERVEALFEQSAARHKLVVADACHSGGLLAAKAYDSRSTERLYEAFNRTSGGTALLLSSRTEEVSLESSGLRSGVFSHYVMRGMRGEADADGDRIVTVDELFAYTYGRVREYTGNRQTPVLSGRFDRGMPVASLR